jgi:hypothetical protein
VVQSALQSTSKNHRQLMSRRKRDNSLSIKL